MKRNRKDGLYRGRFTKKEDQFLIDNHETMTDAKIASRLRREPNAISNRRKRLELVNTRSKPRSNKQQSAVEHFVGVYDALLREALSEVELEYAQNRLSQMAEYIDSSATNIMQVLNMVIAEVQMFRATQKSDISAAIEAQSLLHKLFTDIEFNQQEVIKRNGATATLAWRESVCNKFNSTCVACGEQEDVCAHHIRARHRFPELTNEISNGVCLCRSCHASFHGRYGLGNETLLNQWLEEKGSDFRVDWAIAE